jgi:isopenicillin-N epimerase
VRTDLGWRLDPTWTFLNHGSFGACPTVVLEAQQAWRERLERQPVAFLDRELEGHLDHVRAALGAFLGADPGGLVFVPNATTGVNAVLASLRFQPGDELLTGDHEYNAILTTLAAAAARDGARMVVAPLPFPAPDADALADAFLAGVTDRTRLAVISHVTSPTALVLPVDRIVARLAERGIDTLVDGAHAPGMVPVDLDALGAAYYTGNAHKWLCAPKGAGFLWVRADRREAIRPVVTSHAANDPRVDRDRFRLAFDWVGTADPTAVLSIPAALQAMAALEPGGWPAVMAANHAAAVAGADRLADALGVERPAPDELLGSMAALPLPGPASEARGVALKRALEDERIEVPILGWRVLGARAHPGEPPRRLLVRVSAQRYVEPADVERLASVLPALVAG